MRTPSRHNSTRDPRTAREVLAQAGVDLAAQARQDPTRTDQAGCGCHNAGLAQLYGRGLGAALDQLRAAATPPATSGAEPAPPRAGAPATA